MHLYMMSSEIKMIVKLETVLASNYLYVMALVIKLLYIYTQCSTGKIGVQHHQGQGSLPRVAYCTSGQAQFIGQYTVKFYIFSPLNVHRLSSANHLPICLVCEPTMSSQMAMSSDNNAFQCWKFNDVTFLMKSEKSSNMSEQCKVCTPVVKMLDVKPEKTSTG